MAARVGQAICWIATILAFSVGALALAASIVALAMFAFGVHHLASQMGLANWSSLGVGALFVALLGGIWLMGNSFLDIIAASGSHRYATKRSRRIEMTLPWLIVAAVTGALFYLFGE
jgi:Na+/phosphate symporter